MAKEQTTCPVESVPASPENWVVECLSILEEEGDLAEQVENCRKAVEILLPHAFSESKKDPLRVYGLVTSLLSQTPDDVEEAINNVHQALINLMHFYFEDFTQCAVFRMVNMKVLEHISDPQNNSWVYEIMSLKSHISEVIESVARVKDIGQS